MSNLNYDVDPNFQSMIDNLIDGSWGNTSDNFSGNTLLDDNGTNYSRRTNQLWNQLLIHMHNKFATFDNNKYHYGIRENDFPIDKESIVEFINNNIDLDKDGVSLLDKYFSSQLEDNSHWNESIAKLAEYYYNLFKNSNNEDEIDKTNITIKDLKNANAGASFLKDSEWVIPWENIDKNSYSDIRKNDKIQNVLSNKDNLQFTQNERLNQYLRLIMPEYKRIVEVEDINRNFWVIGQALTALCGFLFEDDSPLPQLMAALLDEIAQLWENMFFLWLTLSLLSYKNFYEDIETVFLPISNNEIMVNVKFDNFDDTGLEEEKTFEDMDKEDLRELLRKIWEERMEFLKDKYNNCAIVVFPEIRVNNYMKNYYSKAVYIGCIVYDDSLENEEDWLKFIPFNGAMIVDLKEQKIIIPTSSEPPAPDYDEWKIAVVLLDRNDEPTDNIKYFDTIADAATYLKNNISKRYLVHIGDRAGITSLGVRAFDQCVNLVYINIPETVTLLNSSVFQDCTALSNINVPNSVTAIGSYAFYRCSSLTSATLSNNIRNIDQNTFYGCSSLTNIVIPNSVTIIKMSAFGNCIALTNINIPNSVTEIYSNAFQGCTSLTNVNIAYGCYSIGVAAFYGCSSLINITIPNSVTELSSMAFENCTALTNIDIPNSVIEIYKETFANCSSLTTVTISNSVTDIRAKAFKDCSSLSEITIPSSVTSIRYDAFSGCASLAVITVKKEKNSITGAPWGATNAQVIWVNDLLYDETKIAAVLLDSSDSPTDEIEYFDTIADAATYVKNDSSNRYLVHIGSDSGVTSLANAAFYQCTNLILVDIPDAITSFGYSVFYGCSGLKAITVPSSISVITGYTFQGCSALSSVDLPNGISSIDSNAFYECHALENINIPSSVTSIGTHAFDRCSSLKSITVPAGVFSINEGAFQDCSNLENVILLGDVTLFDYAAFANCTSLSSIVIPNTVTYIGTYAFAGCTSLESITIPSSVTSISEYAFGGCTALTTITINKNDGAISGAPWGATNAQIIWNG